jgi:DNA polymerase-1
MDKPLHEQKLLLIDGYNIVRRVYEANPTPDSDGKAEGALKASLGSFKRALEEHDPTHVLVAFDHGGPTWRHEIYPEYKIDRKPLAPELKARMPAFLQQLSEIGIHSVAIEGVEAEDVVATVFHRWKDSGRGECVILSNDVDVCSLIEFGAQIHNHFTHEWHSSDWLQAKHGIPPRLVRDWLALAGDKDEVPGVPGFGAKRAAQYLLKYDGLDNLIRNANEVTGSLGDSLRANLALAELGCQLASLKTDVTVGITWNKILYSAPAAEQAAQAEGDEPRHRPTATKFAKGFGRS